MEPNALVDASVNTPTAPSVSSENTAGITRPISYIRQRRRAREEERAIKNPIILRPERSSVVAGAGTGEQFDQRRRTRPSSEILPRTKLEIRKDVVEGHANFLFEHLMDLHLNVDGEVVDSNVYQGARGEMARWLLQHFKSNGEIDRGKIDAFASSDRGLQMIEEIMDIRTQDEILALGMYLSAAYNALMQGAPDTNTVINVDALGRMFDGRLGALRRSGINVLGANIPFGRFSDRRAGPAGVAMGVAIGAPLGGILGNISENIPGVIASLKYLTETQVGTILGVVGGGIGGGILGREFLTNNGDLDFNALASGLDIIRNSGDQEYLKAISGIDVNDFNVVADQVVWDPNRNAADLNTNVRVRVNYIRERLHTRQKYYKSIDLPLPSSRTVPFTHIGPNHEHREETDTRWGRKIKTRTEEILAVFPNPTFEQRIEADREARADVLRDDLVDYFQKIAGDSFIEGQGWVSSTERVSSLQTKKTEVENDSGAHTKRLTDRKEALGNETTGELGRLKTLSKTLSDRLSKERNEKISVANLIAQQANVIDVSNIFTAEDLLTAINTEINSLTRKISAERRRPRTDLRRTERALRTGTTAVDIIQYRAAESEKSELASSIEQARRIVSDHTKTTEVQRIQDEINAINLDLASGTHARGTPAWSSLQTQLKTFRENTTYQNYRNAEDIVTRYQVADTFLNTLTPLQRDAVREYEIAARGLDSREDTNIIIELKQKISELEVARKAISEGKVTTATKTQELEDVEKSFRPIKERFRTDRRLFEEIGITDAELSTLGISDLIARVNQRYETDVYLGINPPLGWPEGQNNNKSNLDQLVNAKVESRSREYLSASINVMANVMETLNQNREQFSRSSVSAINQSMNEIFVLSGGTQGWEQAANERMSTEIGIAKVIGYDENAAFEYSLDVTMHDIERGVLELDEQIKAVSNGELINRINMGINLMTEQALIFGKISEEFRDSDKRPKFFSIDFPDANDNVYTTPQERASQEVQAYHEFLNLLFKYQSDTDRGAAFHRASLLLPSNELARLLQTSFGLLCPDDLYYVMLETERSFNRGEINERDMRRAVEHVITYVEGHTRGMLN